MAVSQNYENGLGAVMDGRLVPAYVDAKVLVANTAQTITVPALAKVMVITCNQDFYIAATGTATVPSGAVSDGTANALVLSGADIGERTFFVDPADTHSVISASNAIMTIAYYII